MARNRIMRFKSKSKNLMGEWTAQFDLGETQVQIITPIRSDRTLLCIEINKLLKTLPLLSANNQ